MPPVATSSSTLPGLSALPLAGVPAALRSGSLPKAARSVLDILDGLRGVCLEVTLPDGCRTRVGQGIFSIPLEVHDWSLFAAVLGKGDIGFAEGYVDGQWDCAELDALLCALAANRERLGRALHGHWWTLLGARLRHLANANTRAGSRRNIMAHYDLGNAFYAAWLDPGMSYSAALFGEVPGRSLDEAQAAKYRRILRRLDVRPGQHLLEIGCGWGGFAELAAREYGVRVTGITVSPAQLAWARERIDRAGLAGRVRLELVDYRDAAGLGGPYDHVVSIEMFEAVGEKFWPAYFAALSRVLEGGGRALVQSITIRDDLFASYRRQTDFIQQHVFPGGMLPSVAEFGRRAARAGFLLRDRFAFGPDYARTLGLWRDRFEAAWPAIARQGFDEPFRRLWRFYLAYCEAGFVSGSTDVVQFELERQS